MKVLATIVLLLWCAEACLGQVLNATGVRMTVSAGSEVVVDGGARLNAAASFLNDGTVRLLGDWTNNSAGPGFLALSTGNVLMHDPAPQLIQGTAVTNFRDLVISGGTKTLLQNATCGIAAQPDGLLTLNSGALVLNGRSFTLYNAASSALTDAGGSIRSESTDLLSRFVWALGADVSAHNIPFSNAAGVALPFAFSPAAAFATNTLLTVATYPTAANNTPYAATVNETVLHMAGVAVANNTANVVDRFWLTDLPNANLTGTVLLSHAPAEDASLGAGAIRAQRWLETPGTWQPPITGQTNPLTRQVLIPAVPLNNTINPENEHIWAMAYDATPLPVSLLFFSAHCAGNGMHVAWRTATEQNSFNFTVERSIDAMDWVVVSSLDAAGNSNVPMDYRVEDGAPPSGSDVLYRLWQQDIDGTTTMVSMVSATACTTAEILLFPNPADAMVHAALPMEIPRIISVVVHDATGRLVFDQALQPTLRMITLNVGGYAPGSYHVSFVAVDGSWSGTGRFLKQ